ncbi:MAG: hypothetical protein HKN63_00620 [Rhodobacteraceae bacterium]|nr:hypothetical protein [Paracoccaceae bacterium]
MQRRPSNMYRPLVGKPLRLGLFGIGRLLRGGDTDVRIASWHRAGAVFTGQE